MSSIITTDSARVKNKNFSHLSDMLEGILAEYYKNLDPDMLNIWTVWKRAAGEFVSSIAQPAAFKDNVLIIGVKSSSALQQLHFYKKEIIKNLNDALGKSLVYDIKLKISDSS